MKGVILSAGIGSRLKPISSCIPKPLLPVGGKRIIDYVVSYLSDKCEEIVVVLGQMHDLLEEYLKNKYPKIGILKVDSYYTGNLATLLKAKDMLAGNFILANADHVFSKDIWSQFPVGHEGIQIACHRRTARHILEDEMKVRVKEGKLIHMDKKLKSYEGAYIGLAYVGNDLIYDFWKTAEQIFNVSGGDSKVEDIFNEIAKTMTIRVVWVDNIRFYEVDTISDLRRIWNEKRAHHL